MIAESELSAWPSSRIKSVWQLAWRMLTHNRPRLIFTIIGVSTAFFLASAQLGLLVGWTNTTSALIKHAEVDLWLMSENTRALDFGTPIPRQTIYRARSTPEVIWAQGMLVSWNSWVRPDGSSISVQLLGLDKDKVGGPWQMQEGDLRIIDNPQTAIVDELYQNLLQIHARGESVQMRSQRVIIGGFSEGVRSFAGTPHVFMSLKHALLYDQRHRDDEITYVLIRCRQGADVKAVQANMRQLIKHVDVLTSDEFAGRTARYWMLGTGAGIGVILTAVLGVLVGAIIASQTLFATTQENFGNYAALMAIGFERRLLSQVVLLQSLLVGTAGIVIGSAGFVPLVWATARSPLPIEFYPPVLIGLIAIFLVVCILAAGISLRSVFRLDPVVIFSQQ